MKIEITDIPKNVEKIVINIENSEFTHIIDKEPRIEIRQTQMEHIEKQEKNIPDIPDEMNSEF